MSKLPWWLNLFVRILLVDLFLAILVAAWSWITKDFSPLALSNRFFIGGVLLVAISLASAAGNWGHRSDWRQMLAQSAGQANLVERNNRMISDMLQGYALAATLIPAGAIAILFAVLVGNLA